MKLIIIALIVLISNLQSQELSESKYLYTPVKIEIDSMNNSIVFDRIEDKLRFNFFLNQLDRNSNKFYEIADLFDLQFPPFEMKNIEKSKLYEFSYSNNSFMRYSTYEGFPYSQAKSNTYLACGRELESYAAKRTVLLLVDSTVYYPLESEIKRLRDDLVSEGWGVRIVEVNRMKYDEARFINVLDLYYLGIRDFLYYNPNLNTEAVLLIGKTPKFYSGKFAPDNKPNHLGAWPANGLFGIKTAFAHTYRDKENSFESDWERNNYGYQDLVYGYNTFPYKVDLMVGSLDLSGLSSFPESEIELLRRYLNKNHKYRTGQLPFRRRGLIDDKLADEHLREAPASSGWRNFNSMFGPDSISEGDYFSTLADESYMASYACGNGQPFDSLGGVGSSKDFATKQVNTIFTMLYGDYIGDWDSPDNFLRASLASEPSVLTAAWVGHPHWFMHHMSIGYPLGYSTRLTQNNDIYVPLEHFQTDTTSKPYDPYKNGVHVGLLGDPTLTMYPLDLENSVSNLKAEKMNDYTVRLTWDISDMSSTHFYDVFRSNYADGPFDKVTEVSITDGQFVDEYHHTGDVWYMVREKVLEFSPTASFWKHLRGKLVQTDVKSGVEDVSNNQLNIYPNPTNNIINIELRNDVLATSYKIINAEGKRIMGGSQAPANTFAIEVESIPTGSYIIELETTTGEVIIDKFVRR
ncbi:MAG: T9SS type A sorting domain-containing protein [Candidatus Kapaibacterium sp.]